MVALYLVLPVSPSLMWVTVASSSSSSSEGPRRCHKLSDPRTSLSTVLQPTVLFFLEGRTKFLEVAEVAEWRWSLREDLPEVEAVPGGRLLSLSWIGNERRKNRNRQDQSGRGSQELLLSQTDGIEDGPGIEDGGEKKGEVAEN